jgi:hypothetical protein
MCLYYTVSVERIETWREGYSMSQPKLTLGEIRSLREALLAECGNSSIRLREGEYQYDLAKAVASFHLRLYFPDVKDITGQLYGDEKTNDIQFVRKIQTILKKMEKSNIVRILPKKTPWELQRYALISFRFQDSDKNLVVLATDQQIQETQKLLQSASNQQQTYATELGKAKILLVAFMVIASYVLIVWDVAQAVVNPFVFVIAFALAVIGSLVLGKLLSRK